ncbi:MAG: hypothetical protein ACFB2W_06990 [Leptolyngbyaceae cyanobacterium]
MTNLTDDFQVPNIRTQFNSTRSNWKWRFLSQCEGWVESSEFHSSEEDAIAEAMRCWHRDQRQKKAWDLISAALSKAESQGISNQTFFNGLSWLYDQLPELRQTATAPGKALQVLAARDLLKEALLNSRQHGIKDHDFLEGFAWLCYYSPELSSVTGRLERAADAWLDEHCA